MRFLLPRFLFCVPTSTACPWKAKLTLFQLHVNQRFSGEASKYKMSLYEAAVTKILINLARTAAYPTPAEQEFLQPVLQRVDSNFVFVLPIKFELHMYL